MGGYHVRQDKDVHAILKSALHELRNGGGTRSTGTRVFQVLEKCSGSRPAFHDVLETLSGACGTDIDGLRHELDMNPDLKISDIEALFAKVLRSDSE
jgi:hypothetical protein